MSELSIVLWNSAGLRPTTSSTDQKLAFFDKEFKHTRFDVAVFVETHHKAVDPFPQEIIDYSEQYYIHHTPSTKKHTHAGIMILINKKFSVTHTQVLIPGRLLHLVFQDDQTKEDFYLTAIYGVQNTSITKAQFTELVNHLKSHHTQSNYNIILGDFNFCDNDTDRTRGLSKHDKVVSYLWNDFLSNLSVVDPFRDQYPDKIIYSFVSEMGKSRILRAYVSENNAQRVIHQNYTPSPFPLAHKVYSFKIVSEKKKGRGTWKMNVSILKDRAYKKQIQEMISNINRLDVQSPTSWWRLFIRSVRSRTISYCKTKRREEKKIKNLLCKELEDLEAIPPAQISLTQTDRLTKTRGRLREHDLKEVEGYKARIRGLPKYEMKEPNIQFYANLERKKGGLQTIKELKDKTGQPKQETKDILGIVTDFYKDLFTPSPTSKSMQNKLLKNITTSISRDDRINLDSPITLAELDVAVEQLKVDKSPGVDGIPSEFYKEFWPLFRKQYLAFINETENTGFDDWKNTSIITLIFKKGETNEIANYRPISLINVDVKILTKVLTNRLKKILPTIIHRSQTAVDGRHIDNTVHMIRDLIQIANDNNTDACFIFLDQEKAFDRVDRDFLFKIMSKFGIGETYINWIRLVYANATARVKVNGFLTQSIPLLRGVRQGDPLSFYEYLFVNEVLGLQLRNNPNIVGFQIGGEKIVSQHYADDTTISITQNRCFKEVYKELEDYEKASGAKVNYKKTKGLWVGGWKDRLDSPLPMTFTNQNIKTLGVYFGNDDPAMETFQEIHKKLKISMDYWKPLKLSKLAKARVIEIFHASKLWYAATFYSIPPVILKQIQQSVFNYINFPFKKVTIAQDECKKLREHGGLKLIDIDLKSKASKVQYLINLCIRDELSLNKKVFSHLLGTQMYDICGTDLFFLPFSFARQRNLRTNSSFYFEAIKTITLLDLRKRSENIAEEHLYFNRLIKIGDKHVRPLQTKRPEMTKLQTLLTEHENRTAGRDFDRYLVQIYDRLIITDTSSLSSHTVSIDNKELPFEQITTKLLYTTLLLNSYKPHHSLQKWEQKLNGEIDWNSVWKRIQNKLAFEGTKSAVLEQIHLNFYTQYNFNKWHNKKEDCRLCGQQPQDVYHIILDCKFSSVLWKDLHPALDEIHKVNITTEEMVFGLKGNTPPVLLRNFLTFVLREVITHMELKAYYEHDFQTNLEDAKLTYNKKINDYIQMIFDSYKYNDRPDLFDRYFCANDSLVEKETEDTILVTLPFAV